MCAHNDHHRSAASESLYIDSIVFSLQNVFTRLPFYVDRSLLVTHPICGIFASVHNKFKFANLVAVSALSLQREHIHTQRYIYRKKERNEYIRSGRHKSEQSDGQAPANNEPHQLVHIRVDGDIYLLMARTFWAND